MNKSRPDAFQYAGHDIPLTVLRSHAGNHHVHSLFGGQSGRLGIRGGFQPALPWETESAQSPDRISSHPVKTGIFPVNKPSHSSAQGRLARATAPKSQNTLVIP